MENVVKSAGFPRFISFITPMQDDPDYLAYSDGLPAKLGDIVTGHVDAGSFPAEPFLAQVAFIYPDKEKVQVVPLRRPPSLSAAAALFKRQTRVAEIYADMPMKISALRLHQRCSRPLSKRAAVLATAPNAVVDQPWRESLLFKRSLKPQRLQAKELRRIRKMDLRL
jgi:hypothetical protein